MVPLLLAALFGVSAPSAEAQRLGRKLAEQGTLASLLPLLKSKETAELLKEDPGLSAAEQTKLRATAERVFEVGYGRLMKATGDAYAQQLSVADLRALTHFYQSPVAARYRAATPQVIRATMRSVGEMDFKGDVRAAFCAETRRLCSSK
jgi:hypothetical protein